MSNTDDGDSSGTTHLHTFTIVLIVLLVIFVVITLVLCLVTFCTKTLCFSQDDHYSNYQTEDSKDWWGRRKKQEQEVVAVVDTNYVVGQDYHPR